MSETAESSETTRWRALSDVLLGVALCVSLLVPAVKQASKGTLGGLGAAMVLLVLNAVLLVMLSKYVTRPERDAVRRRPARRVRPEEVLTAGPVLSREEASALFDDRGAPCEVPGLSFSDVGIAVRQGVEVTSHANLAWTDCVAVVYSRLPAPGGTVFTSLQFVSVREDLIRRGPRDRHARAAARVLGLTETAASMVWVAPPPLMNLPPLVLDYLRRQHPRVRIVQPDVIEDP